MIKKLHIFFVLVSFGGFITRSILAEVRPESLQAKWLKISPHIIDTLLLASGVLLVIQGHWLSSEHGWIIAKISALLGYILFGVLTLRMQSSARWSAFVAAVLCYFYIVLVAITKNALFFLTG